MVIFVFGLKDKICYNEGKVFGLASQCRKLHQAALKNYTSFLTY
jgi:hypothetical protein